jgi:hypothetical protein
MFQALKKYVQLNPINTATYTICGTSTGITLVDILSDGKIDSGNIVALGLAGLAVIGATVSSMYQKRVYDNTCQLIEEYGFTPEILQNKRTKKLAKIFAEEHDRVDEYQAALKQYQLI